MSTYIESAIADFIKTIITRGFKTLTSTRFLPYTIFLLLIVVPGTIIAFIPEITKSPIGESLMNNLLFIEISASIAFILVGLFFGRIDIKFQMILLIGFVTGITAILITIDESTDISTKMAAVMYIVWIGIVTLSTFSLIRDLFGSEIFGTVLFFGKPRDDGKVMFQWLCFLLIIINFSLGYLIYKEGISKSTYYSGIFIMITATLALIPLLGFQRKNDVFFTIITWFYMFTTIRVFLLAFRILSDTAGETSYWDTLFSLFIALYTIQNAAVKGVKIGQKSDKPLEEELMEQQKGLGFSTTIAKLLSDRGIVLVILGIVLGFHTMQVQTILGRGNIFQDFPLTKDADIVLLGYEVNLAISLLIYILSLILFLIFPPFRRYIPEVQRIPWAPPYDDLKLVISSIKDGDISWKGDVMKLMIGVGKDKIAAKFGRKPKSFGDRFTDTWGTMIGKSKKKDK